MPRLKFVVIALVVGLVVLLAGIQPAPGSSHKQGVGCRHHADDCDCAGAPCPGCSSGGEIASETGEPVATSARGETASASEAAERTGRTGRENHSLPDPPFVPLAYEGPPPGTLGITYWQSSRLIPPDKHPRTAMVDVWAPGARLVTAQSTTGFRHVLTGWQNPCVPGLWHFETDEPLMPGIPHLCEVTATYCEHGCPAPDVRTIRLIWGRIVSLAYAPYDERYQMQCAREAEPTQAFPTPVPDFAQPAPPPEPAP